MHCSMQFNGFLWIISAAGELEGVQIKDINPHLD